MTAIISNISSEDHININILQYIRNNKIDVQNEISNIGAGKNLDIVINQFFSSSTDYLFIYTKIIAAKEKIKAAGHAPNIQLQKELEDLVVMESDFKKDSLVLAQLLLSIKVSSARIDTAMQLFNAGKIKAAYESMDTVDMTGDQASLLLQADFYEARSRIAN